MRSFPGMQLLDDGSPVAKSRLYVGVFATFAMMCLTSADALSCRVQPSDPRRV
jgi:hypothetical protein